MKVLLAAVNAKYIHSNLAVRSLRAYAEQKMPEGQIQVAEFTINQQKDYILQEIYQKKPDILAFSCYIWNISQILELTETLHQVLPGMQIWLGGPEVSYESRQILENHKELTGIMLGEGERIFLRLMQHYQKLEDQFQTALSSLDRKKTQVGLEQIPGLLFHSDTGIMGSQVLPETEYLPMDEVPFVYQDLTEFDHKIIYYESSRGCPFSCSYCLSSIDKRVRLRSLELVYQELQFFLDHQVPQVKFVDRTFNCNHAHAMGIWTYIREHDNQVTNFHFEVEADLLTEEEIALLNRMRPGLVQLEIGVQSVNENTLAAVQRRTDFGKITAAVHGIARGRNIHQHLDLIAGLPQEDFSSFRHSFNTVYGLHPQELQLGFLKVLKGSAMYDHAPQYELVYRKQPPYEVLSTKWISFDEILKLKGLEEMLEVYYNSQQFSHTIGQLESRFETPFDLYLALADYYESEGLNGTLYSRMQRLEILRSFAAYVDPGEQKKHEANLLLDLYLRENAKSRPNWAPGHEDYKRALINFYKKEEQERKYLPEYASYDWKQMRKMTHVEAVSGQWLLFDYQKRDPLTGDARVVDITNEIVEGEIHD